MDINKEELEKIYKELYLSYGNNEKIIDYETLVRMYTLYLALFLNKGGSFYHDVQFLIYVINGFKHFHDVAYDDEEVTKDVMFEEIKNHEIDLRRRMFNDSLADEKREVYTDSDLILWYSLEIFNLLKNMGLTNEYNEELLTLAVNSYRVAEKMNGKGMECKNSGMEYWKRNN